MPGRNIPMSTLEMFFFLFLINRSGYNFCAMVTFFAHLLDGQILYVHSFRIVAIAGINLLQSKSFGRHHV